MSAETTARTETAEMSAAKNIVWDVLDKYISSDDLDELLAGVDLIDLSDEIIETLVEAGVYIPQGLKNPDGYYQSNEDDDE